MVWKNNKEAYLLKFKDKIITRGAKIQGRYIQTSNICFSVETKQLLSFILVGDFYSITQHLLLKRYFSKH